MKTDYEYIKFIEVNSQGKTSKWDCHNVHHGEKLGEIKWHGAWRQYCYFPTVQAVYSKGCLNDIADFLTQLNKKP